MKQTERTSVMEVRGMYASEVTCQDKLLPDVQIYHCPLPIAENFQSWTCFGAD